MKKIIFLIFLIESLSKFTLFCQGKYQGILVDGKEMFFKERDIAFSERMPRIYRLILDNDLSAIKALPSKETNHSFRLNGETYSPLSFACKHEKFEIAYLLIEKGASISKKNNLGEFPLHFFCFSGNNDTILARKMIFPEVFTVLDKNRHTPLFYAMESGNDFLFDFILSEYLKVNPCYNSSEVKECFIYSKENLHVIQKTCKLFDLNKPFFLDQSRIFFEKYLPIKDAIERANMYNGLRRVYGQEFERPKDDSFDIKMFKLLIENGMDLNVKFEKGRSILFQIYEDKPLVNFLCDKVDNLNLVDGNSQTFLQFYIESCVTPPTMLLNGHEVYIDDLDRDYTKEFDVIDFLISKGAIINDKVINGNGWVYLLIHASKKKNEFIIKQFFKKYEKSLYGDDLWELIKSGTSLAQFEQLKYLFESIK